MAVSILLTWAIQKQQSGISIQHFILLSPISGHHFDDELPHTHTPPLHPILKLRFPHCLPLRQHAVADMRRTVLLLRHPRLLRGNIREPWRASGCCVRSGTERVGVLGENPLTCGSQCHCDVGRWCAGRKTLIWILGGR